MLFVKRPHTHPRPSKSKTSQNMLLNEGIHTAEIDEAMKAETKKRKVATKKGIATKRVNKKVKLAEKKSPSGHSQAIIGEDADNSDEGISFWFFLGGRRF